MHRPLRSCSARRPGWLLLAGGLLLGLPWSAAGRSAGAAPGAALAADPRLAARAACLVTRTEGRVTCLSWRGDGEELLERLRRQTGAPLAAQWTLGGERLILASSDPSPGSGAALNGPPIGERGP